eukprot:g40710.t1
MRSGPVMYKIQVGETLLNKHVDDMKAANLLKGQEQNIPGALAQPESLLEPVDSPPLSSIAETTADVTDLMLPPEEGNEFPLRCSGHWRWAMLRYISPTSEVESEKLDPVRKQPTRGYKEKNRPTSPNIEEEGYSDYNEISQIDLIEMSSLIRAINQ